MIIDNHNRLVWFKPMEVHDTALDFRTQTYEAGRC